MVSAEVWPDGLHPLVDRVRELGMQFGLWFEPEMVNPDSDVARAHPEWIMAARPEWPVESRHQQVLNLGIPEAYEHVKGQMLALLDEYDIGYIKWDHNRDLVEAGTQTDGGRPGVHAQTLAFYRLLDELRAAHPGAGDRVLLVGRRPGRPRRAGAHRPGLGLRQHRPARPAAHAALDRPAGPAGVPGLAHRVRPLAHRPAGATTSGFRAGTAIFGHLGIEWDLAEASEPRLAELRAWIAFYKEQRGLLLTGDLVRMDGTGDRIHLHGVVAPDRSRALFAFAPVDSLYPDPAPRLRLRGLDPERTYRVRPVIVGAAPSGLTPPQLVGRSRVHRARSSPAPRWSTSASPPRSCTPIRWCSWRW